MSRGSGPQHVRQAKLKMESAMMELFDEATAYARSEESPTSNKTYRRKSLLEQARIYSASVDALTRVRKR